MKNSKIAGLKIARLQDQIKNSCLVAWLRSLRPCFCFLQNKPSEYNLYSQSKTQEEYAPIWGQSRVGVNKAVARQRYNIQSCFFLSQFCCKDQGEQVFLVCAEAPAPCNLRIKLTAHKFRNLTLRPLWTLRATSLNITLEFEHQLT